MALSIPLRIGIVLSILMALVGVFSTIETTLLPKWRAEPTYYNADLISKECQVSRGGWVEGDTPEGILERPKAFDPVPVPLSSTMDNVYTSTRAVNAYFYFRCLIEPSRFRNAESSPYVALGPLYGKKGWVFVNGKKMASFEQRIFYSFFVPDTTRPLLIEIVALPRVNAVFAGMGSIIHPAIYFKYADYERFMNDLVVTNSFYGQVICGILIPICMLFWIMFFRGFRYQDVYWIAIGVSMQLFSYGLGSYSDQINLPIIPFLIDLSTRIAQISMLMFGYHFLRIKAQTVVTKVILIGAPILAFITSTALILKYMPARIPHLAFSSISIVMFSYYIWLAVSTIRMQQVSLRRKINLVLFSTISVIYIGVVIFDLRQLLSIDNKLWLGLLLCDFFFAAVTFIEIMDRQKTHAKEQETFDKREEERHILETQLSLGKTVQKLLLPKDLHGRFGELSFMFHYTPSQSMSGDWITDWKDQAGNEHLILGDVVGKGPQAAIAVTAIMSIIHKAKGQTQPLTAILKDVHEFLGSLFQHHITSTVTAVSLHPDGSISLFNCGGQGWFHITTDNTKGVPLRGSLLGGATPFQAESSRVTLNPGERLLTFTDGVIDGSRSVMKLIRTLKAKAVTVPSDEGLIDLAIEVGKGSAHSDDKAVLVISRAK